jgi:hypothetical protein
MKKAVLAGIAIALGIAGTIFVRTAKSQGAPFVMSAIDAANWRAVNAELANMEKQYFDAIKPDQDVRNELAARNCAIAKLELKDCSITQDPTNRSRIIVSHTPPPALQSQLPGPDKATCEQHGGKWVEDRGCSAQPK